ncbi:MAG: hypothetical protein KKC68_04300 [Candidatus Thermoplasmatota archaeon]|nr:hypothetical protein [Candidatus Thermoplasmatota archaeon]MBU1940972.1 hypothetical protein [Candidatus Thermoplasmatota archaeon]
MKHIHKKALLKYLGVISIILMMILPVNSLGAEVSGGEHTVMSVKDEVVFSMPQLSQTGEGMGVDVQECTSVLTTEGLPMLPVSTMLYELPIGSTICSVDVRPQLIEMIPIADSLIMVPPRALIGMKSIAKSTHVEDAWASGVLYPESWYSVTMGAGLNRDNEHVLFVSLQLYPVRYAKDASSFSFCAGFEVKIEYTSNPGVQVSRSDAYDMLIIAPEAYSEVLEPLLTHKNAMGLVTTIMTYEDIQSIYAGRDGAEDMKLCIKDAVEQWNITYVLLVGDVQRLPTRITYASPWEPDVLSDLYFSDIYDADMLFCSWDANENNRFGEVQQLGGWPPQINNLDAVDLFADVHVGRLACVNTTEVELLVQKIITYETTTYGASWFDRIALAGGDTFPLGMGALPFVYEGEITNKQVMEELPEFEHITLWTSDRNLNAITFNNAINSGVGFVTYAGHGFEHGWSTYRPNSLRRKMTLTQPLYYTPFIQYLENQEQLPIIFFDACLTGKLDFNITDLRQYYRDLIDLLITLGKVDNDPLKFFPCFAWRFLTEPDGGAIATIGATRSAYSWVDTNGAHAGAGYLDVAFFRAYAPGRSVGMMLTLAQNDYIANVYKDYFTIEEYLLFGDPSLMVGGYPTN